MLGAGFVMTKADFALYLGGLSRFTFADQRLVLHVLLADLIFIVLPFTKVIHAFLSLPLNIVRRKPWIRG
jgi:nitrate reductase gamma subunit